MPSLIKLHKEQLERDGVNYPLPDIFDEDGNQAAHIPCAIVLVNGDKVEGAVLFESKGVEMTLIGCSPRLTAVIKREQDGILYTLRSMGFRWIRTLVTRTRLTPLREPLRQAEFRRDDPQFASFFREI
jgi:hypothetical protein